MESTFRRVVEHVFNNWTALKLAVQHSMGGPDSQSVAVNFVDYITKFCLTETSIDVGVIQEVLEDVMDFEFETICEDGSVQEIAAILYNFLLLLKAGNLTQYELEYNKLPTNNDWLIKSQAVTEATPGAGSSGVQPTPPPKVQSNNESPMEEDSEWTEVKTKRKK